MTRLLMFVFSSAVAFCAQVSTEADKKGAIEGTVVSATTGAPLRKAEVTVNLSGEPHAVATMTDKEGKFVLEDLDPGEYEISATRFGYLESDRLPSIGFSAVAFEFNNLAPRDYSSQHRMTMTVCYSKPKCAASWNVTRPK